MGPLRRLAVYFLAWAAATAVAVLVAWRGVAVVGTQVTETRPAPLTPEQARAARHQAAPRDSGQAPPTPAAAGPTGSGSAPGEPVGPATTTTRTSPSGASGGQASTSTTATTRGTGGAGANDTPGTPERRTYNLAGGSVALEFRPSGVSVLWAEPALGHTVRVEDGRRDGVLVVFEGAERSSVEAWWDDGPADRIENGPDEGSGTTTTTRPSPTTTTTRPAPTTTTTGPTTSTTTTTGPTTTTTGSSSPGEDPVSESPSSS